jgi:hypothetical protein
LANSATTVTGLNTPPNFLHENFLGCAIDTMPANFHIGMSKKCSGKPSHKISIKESKYVNINLSTKIKLQYLEIVDVNERKKSLQTESKRKEKNIWMSY